MSRVESLSGYWAIWKRHVEAAHRLGPNDVQIRYAWIDTLSRERRNEETKALLEDERLMKAPERTDDLTSLEHAPVARDECRAVTPQQSAAIPIRPIAGGNGRVEALALDVAFNGKRRRLEIDTGASGLVISRNAAAGLNLVREQKTVTGGFGDERAVASSIAHAESIKIGEIEFQHCSVRILEEQKAMGIDGLIGGNFFRRYLLTLDYPKGEVRLEALPKRPQAAGSTADAGKAGDADPPAAAEQRAPIFKDPYIAPEMKDWTPVYESQHELLLPVFMGRGKTAMGTTKLFVIDTGSQTMLVSPDAAREVTTVRSDHVDIIRGIAGEVGHVYDAGDFLFGFANLRENVARMTSVDTTKFSQAAGVEISGFLGAPVLNLLTIHIDYRDQLVKFDYAPKR